MSEFPCVQCGACCRLVAAVPGMQSFDRGDGGCKHLTQNNLCAIYAQRPALCRVERSCPPVMEEAEWFRRNEEACSRLHLHVYGQPIARY